MRTLTRAEPSILAVCLLPGPTPSFGKAFANDERGARSMTGWGQLSRGLLLSVVSSIRGFSRNVFPQERGVCVCVCLYKYKTVQKLLKVAHNNNNNTHTHRTFSITNTWQKNRPSKFSVVRPQKNLLYRTVRMKAQR